MKNLTMIFDNVKKFVNNNAPEILLGIGIGGFIGASVMAIAETPKAMRILEDAEIETGEDLDVPDKIKLTWKLYAAPIAIALCSGACLVESNRIHRKHASSLAAACALSETAFATYRRNVIETIGEKKEQLVQDKIAKEDAEKNPPTKSQIILLGGETTVFKEPITGYLFSSSIQQVQRAEIELNSKISQGFASLNDWLNALDIPTSEFGDTVGWNGNREGYVGITFKYPECPGLPYIYICLSCQPCSGFDKYYI